MQINIEIEENVVYIRSDLFGMTFFREYEEDLFGYDGPEKYEDMCIKIAETVLNEA